MNPFIVDITAVLSIFIGAPFIIVSGIVAGRFLNNKRRELELREREIALEERRLALDEQAYNQALLEDS